MEYLNRIELTGIVGQCTVNNIGGVQHARFTVATSYCYTDSQGEYIMETTWHNVSAWEGENLSLKGLEKGAHVNLVGRLRVFGFLDATGVRCNGTEIVANTLNIIL